MNILKKLIRRGRTLHQRFRQDPAVNTNCSEFEVDNWVISDFILHRLVPVVDTHPFPLCELNLMVAAVCRLKPTLIFEWGTNIGKSARVFYETARHFGLDTEVHSIDLPDDVDHQEHPKSQRGVLVKGCPAVTLHVGDGLTKTLEIYQSAATAGAPLVFIDGDHSYESVKRELTGIIQNMPTANVLLHDTFYQSPASGYNIGPYRAIVDALAAVPNDFKVMATTTGLPGMTLLYRL